MRTIVHHFIDPSDRFRGSSVDATSDAGEVIAIDADPAKGPSTELRLYFGVSDGPEEAARQLDEFIAHLIEMRARAIRRASVTRPPKHLQLQVVAQGPLRPRRVTSDELAEGYPSDGALGNDPQSDPSYRRDMIDAGRGEQLP